MRPPDAREVPRSFGDFDDAGDVMRGGALTQPLGEALIGHIRDNPKFWRYVMRKERKAT